MTFDLFELKSNTAEKFTVWRGISDNKNNPDPNLTDNPWDEIPEATKLCTMWVKIERDENSTPLIRYLGTRIESQQLTSQYTLANRVLIFYTGANDCDEATVSGPGINNMDGYYGNVYPINLSDFFYSSDPNCKLEFECDNSVSDNFCS